MTSMWLGLAFLSALTLGLYDVAKKSSLVDNAVLPVLFLSTLFSTLFFAPVIIASLTGADLFEGTLLAIPQAGWRFHLHAALKGAIVASTWTFGYYGMKHLPLTIVGPINATRPVLVLLGSILIFGERLNAFQWAGVSIALASFYLLSRSSRKESINFGRDRWVWCMIAAMFTGVVSALYDKYLMGMYDAVAVQSWSNLYITIIMGAVTLLFWWPKRHADRFEWRWSILLISLFITVADFTYFTSLGTEGSMLSIVSLVRRSSVIVSFICGALLFKEKNLRGKAVDLSLLLVGLVFLLLGSMN